MLIDSVLNIVHSGPPLLLVCTALHSVAYFVGCNFLSCHIAQFCKSVRKITCMGLICVYSNF